MDQSVLLWFDFDVTSRNPFRGSSLRMSIPWYLIWVGRGRDEATISSAAFVRDRLVVLCWWATLHLALWLKTSFCRIFIYFSVWLTRVFISPGSKIPPQDIEEKFQTFMHTGSLRAEGLNCSSFQWFNITFRFVHYHCGKRGMEKRVFYPAKLEVLWRYFVTQLPQYAMLRKTMGERHYFC